MKNSLNQTKTNFDDKKKKIKGEDSGEKGKKIINDF